MRVKALAFDASGTLFDVHCVVALCEMLFPGHGEALRCSTSPPALRSWSSRTDRPTCSARWCRTPAWSAPSPTC